jgi:heme/copper-type cytochrome/quinol oxidase subunit 4
MSEQVTGEAPAQRRGLIVFIALAVLTAIEYVVAVSLDSTSLLIALLAVAAGAKCWAITVYFMHISRLWRGEEAHS